jgi:hypothetical protein
MCSCRMCSLYIECVLSKLKVFSLNRKCSLYIVTGNRQRPTDQGEGGIAHLMGGKLAHLKGKLAHLKGGGGNGRFKVGN